MRRGIKLATSPVAMLKLEKLPTDVSHQEPSSTRTKKQQDLTEPRITSTSKYKQERWRKEIKYSDLLYSPRNHILNLFLS